MYQSSAISIIQNQSYNNIQNTYPQQPSNFLMETETSHHQNYVSPTTPMQNINNIIIPLKDHSTSFSTAYLKSSEPMKPSVEDSEISIFDAQKYFNETNLESDTKDERPPSPALVIPRTPIPRLTSVSSSSTATDTRIYSKNYREQSFHANPTASSEASWNSQTGLLSNPPGASPVTIPIFSENNNNSNLIHKEKRKGGGGGTKWFFRRKSPCAGKKSVQVKHKIQIPQPVQLNAKREINEHHELVPRIQETKLFVPVHHNHPLSSSSLSHDDPFPANGFHNQRQEHLSSSIRRLSEGPISFSFPILSNAPAPPQFSTNPFDDLPRKSLEVFQPWEDKTVPRKTGARASGFRGGQMLCTTAMEDDIASDASSDLFEIESFSTQTTYFRPPEEVHNFHSNPRITAGNNTKMYSCRRSTDEPMTPSIAPTEGYEPSEASIDWSVTTAEGFDRQSVTNFSVSASEIDITVPQRQTWATSSTGGGGREGSRKKGNGGGLPLLSCRHEKAVSVGPQPVKYVTAVRGDQGQPPAMFPLVSSLRHVSTRGQNCNKPLSVADYNSAQLPLAFAV